MPATIEQRTATASGPDGTVTETRTVGVDVTAEQIRTAGLAALATNRTYLAIGSPTAAQTTAQAKALSRQMNGVLRLLLGQLDGTD